MAFDLSWLWELLNSITSTLNTWFASIWTQVQTIVNTGQGVFSGLVAFGSQLWDAITKFASTIGEWLGTAYNYIREGLENAFNVFGQWLNNAYTYLSQGVAWIGSQFYNIGNWIYNSALYVWNWIVNTLTGIWTALTEWFAGVSTAIGSWWGSVISGINTWWTNLLKGFRTKIVQTIMADLSITMAWKGAERFMTARKLSDIGYGLLSIIGGPIVGYTVGRIVDAVVPLPSSTSYPLVPDISGFTYTPPSLTITTPTEKAPPSPAVTGVPAGPFTGVSEVNLGNPSPSYEVNIRAGQDLSANPSQLDYEVVIT